ncbi:proteoglycan 4-like [Leptopilina heterotoma]|uniref:proteoglycan 4-like n=1 Tax=Leptopilina heterotoma TaxID=63436 RepID=UPI001CA9D6CD|nr:proteoglycan 4-like [Leptopilina heterotoma]
MGDNLASSESEWTDSLEETDQDNLDNQRENSENKSPPLCALPISSGAKQKVISAIARVSQSQDNSKIQQRVPRSSKVEPKPKNPLKVTTLQPNPTYKLPVAPKKEVPSSSLEKPPYANNQTPSTSSLTPKATSSTKGSKIPTTSKEIPVVPRKILTRNPAASSAKLTIPKRGQSIGSTKPKEPHDEEPYVPPAGSKPVDPDVSSIGERLRRRKQEIREKACHQEDESSSSDESTTETDKEENSDAPVFRESHSVLPSVPPQLPPKNPITPKETTDQPSTPCIPTMSSSYTDVYVDGACCDNGGIRPRAGIGVWFGPEHPLNVSQRSTGRQTNNASEIEAATTAIKKAKRAGINQLRIKTDSKVLVQGIQEWVPKWQKNDWKTNENKPVKNKSAYERLVKAMKGLDVIYGNTCLVMME